MEKHTVVSYGRSKARSVAGAKYHGLEWMCVLDGYWQKRIINGGRMNRKRERAMSTCEEAAKTKFSPQPPFSHFGRKIRLLWASWSRIKGVMVMVHR